MGTLQLAGRLLVMREKLDESIDGHELYAGVRVDVLTRHLREHPLHHPVCAMVTVVERLAAQEPLRVHQPVIDAPRIDAHALKRASFLARLAQASERLIPELE